MITVKETSESKKFRAYLDTASERIQFAMATATFEAARALQEDLMTKLPSGKAWAGLRSALRLGRVSTSKGEAAYGVYADLSGLPKQKARKLDVKTTVVYIRPKRSHRVRVPEQVQVLAQFSPWTMDSLPFFPSKRHATLISKSVSDKEVDRIKAIREGDRTKWEPMLAKLGIRVKDKLELPPKAAVVEDVAFRAIRLEFGGAEVAARPIWRPAIRSLAKGRIQSMLLAGPAGEAITNPNFQGFRNLPSGEFGLSEGALARYNGFQKRLNA